MIPLKKIANQINNLIEHIYNLFIDQFVNITNLYLNKV